MLAEKVYHAALAVYQFCVSVQFYMSMIHDPFLTGIWNRFAGKSRVPKLSLHVACGTGLFAHSVSFAQVMKAPIRPERALFLILFDISGHSDIIDCVGQGIGTAASLVPTERRCVTENEIL